MKKITGIEQLNKKMPTLDKYLIFCFTVILIYTVVGIVFQWVTSIELSTSLTLGVYGFFGGEITLLAMIKRLKLKGGDSNDMD